MVQAGICCVREKEARMLSTRETEEQARHAQSNRVLKICGVGTFIGLVVAIALHSKSCRKKGGLKNACKVIHITYLGNLREMSKTLSEGLKSTDQIFITRCDWAVCTQRYMQVEAVIEHHRPAVQSYCIYSLIVA